MDPHVTDKVIKPRQVTWAGNLPTKCDTLTYKTIRNTLHFMW